LPKDYKGAEKKQNQGRIGAVCIVRRFMSVKSVAHPSVQWRRGLSRCFIFSFQRR
jgi:hypothetical protein